jgi:hypothetical protein
LYPSHFHPPKRSKPRRVTTTLCASFRTAVDGRVLQCSFADQSIRRVVCCARSFFFFVTELGSTASLVPKYHLFRRNRTLTSEPCPCDTLAARRRVHVVAIRIHQLLCCFESVARRQRGRAPRFCRRLQQTWSWHLLLPSPHVRSTTPPRLSPYFALQPNSLQPRHIYEGRYLPTSITVVYDS